ncbi:GTP 3',8-cyclase MoaA [Archaeoglobus veneficus]|uniref:Probable GTP 3',8-cyclase n=1 Tax=Archaeoglobus veneficus (strain DSM 11195 / SNP6) TaxID=693661 RepID=F2KP05_ARCVS|nr:GTP 3',8-cyclase MoaA [Archaeoglobus veneficus]AEA46313.1 molybdenum cofactor biosynthesis protein A [Archaeoglobus veneficus SNP6]
MLVDRFGRRITNLRIAVTNRCNLSCIYCHREGEVNPGEEMHVEEISRISKAFYELGIRKVKITGGEPLLREDIVEIVQSFPPFDEISITTNGTLLARMADELKDAGLSRVNVSLDTLKEDTYGFITGGGNVQKVIDGIEAACNAGLTPVKVNMVVMKGLNENEVENMLEFTSKFNRGRIDVILQVIELLKLPGLEEYYYDISPIEERYAGKAKAVIVRSMHMRRQYVLDNAAIEFVKPLDNSEFCMHCNRIRVTSDGKIKPCLLRNDNLVDVRGLDGRELKEAIMRAVTLREPYFCDRD